MNDLTQAAIERALRGRFGRPLRVYPSIGSTNTDALEWTAAGAPEGAVVVTNHQTAGRGRWDRTWFSAPGTALQFSVVLRPDLETSRFGLLTTLIGVAVAEGIEAVAPVSAQIKWPNDVLIGGRKTAGILVESRSTSHRIEVAVAGIGINVLPLPDDAPAEVLGRATSVGSESPQGPPDRAELLAAVLSRLEQLYETLKTSHGTESLLERAGARSAILGRDVTVRRPGGETLDGRALRLLPSGALEIETDGTTTSVHVAEIEQIRPVDADN